MEDNTKRYNFEINYLDSNNEIVWSDHYQNITKLEAWYNAEHNCPKDRTIEDFSICEELAPKVSLVEDSGFTDWQNKGLIHEGCPEDSGYQDYLKKLEHGI